MSLLLHLSDTHFGTERPQVVEALVRLVRAQRPDLLVLSGDITQRARPEQFRAARAFVDRLAVPTVVVIPGNHDIPLYQLAVRALMPYSRYRREFGTDLEPELDTPELLLLALNTTRRYRHVDGTLSRRQIERVARRLSAAAPEQVRIVVTHQPVAVTRPEDEHDRVHGHDLAVRRWAEAGADLVLGGHIHLPSLQALHERIPGLARPVWAVQAGTGLSSRIRHEADNSVNLIRFGRGAGDPAGVGAVPALRHSHVARWDYDATTDDFGLVDPRWLWHGETLTPGRRA